MPTSRRPLALLAFLTALLLVLGVAPASTNAPEPSSAGGTSSIATASDEGVAASAGSGIERRGKIKQMSVKMRTFIRLFNKKMYKKARTYAAPKVIRRMRNEPAEYNGLLRMRGCRRNDRYYEGGHFSAGPVPWACDIDYRAGKEADGSWYWLPKWMLGVEPTKGKWKANYVTYYVS